MTLTDSGPLIALFDRRDPYHAVAVQTASQLPMEPLRTTWPVVTEAMYMLGRIRGIVGQKPLWTMIRERKLEIDGIHGDGALRMEQLMTKYADLPMDLADASLVALAEQTGLRRIFAFDHHFRVYRLADGSTMDVVP